MQPATVIRLVALFDLIATLPMAIPGVADIYLSLLLSGFGTLAAPSSLLPLPLTTALFCNLAGILAVAWNGYRLKYPRPSITQFDVVARLAVAALLLYYLLARDAPAPLWIFVASELLGSLIQYLAVKRERARTG